jgi:hypothetical protein
MMNWFSAKMRDVPQNITQVSSNYTSYYVTAGVLTLAAIVLNML